MLAWPPSHKKNANTEDVRMRLWHRFRAWKLLRDIKRQRRELAYFLRCSSYQIHAWKQDIAFLEEEAAYHLKLAGAEIPSNVEESAKVVCRKERRPEESCYSLRITLDPIRSQNSAHTSSPGIARKRRTGSASSRWPLTRCEEISQVRTVEGEASYSPAR
jgi:hypothetical protein